MVLGLLEEACKIWVLASFYETVAGAVRTKQIRQQPQTRFRVLRRGLAGKTRCSSPCCSRCPIRAAGTQTDPASLAGVGVCLLDESGSGQGGFGTRRPDDCRSGQATRNDLDLRAQMTTAQLDKNRSLFKIFRTTEFRTNEIELACT